MTIHGKKAVKPTLSYHNQYADDRLSVIATEIYSVMEQCRSIEQPLELIRELGDAMRVIISVRERLKARRG